MFYLDSCILYTLTVLIYRQQIAGYLIIYRLADGRAWNKSTFEFEGTLPTLQFQHSKSAGTATTESNLETPVDRTTYFLPGANAHQTHTV